MPRTRKAGNVLNVDGHPLTPSETKFIDEYIKTGNATQSYIVAYNKDPENPPKGIANNAYKVLNKQHIKVEIEHRLQQLQQESIADATEILQYFTSVMRGEVKDQFGLEASLGERTKCAQELAKRQIDMMNRATSSEQPEVKITIDWKRDNTPPTVSEISTNLSDDGK